MACELSAVACVIYLPDQGLNLGPLRWEHGILVSGPLGKSHPFMSEAGGFARLLG